MARAHQRGKRFSAVIYTLCIALILCLSHPSSAQLPPWEELVAAAKREGRVAVMGPAGAKLRQELTEPFEKKYGISVEYFSGRGSEFAPKLQAERSAGQYLWDVLVANPLTILSSVIPAGAADPLRPALIDPEVRDAKKWRDGRLEFADNAQTYNMVFLGTPKVVLAYNKDLLGQRQLRSYRDLLKPEWKGQIVTDDPRVIGAGFATFSFFYLHPELGESFIRELAKQEIQFIRDHRQRAEWIAHGKSALMIAPSETVSTPLIQRGLPLGMIQGLVEGTYLTASTGSVTLINRAPHPSGAKLYVNWLLSAETQEAWARTTGTLSRRLDVSADHVASYSRLLPGMRYFPGIDSEDGVARTPEILNAMKNIFK